MTGHAGLTIVLGQLLALTTAGRAEAQSAQAQGTTPATAAAPALKIIVLPFDFAAPVPVPRRAGPPPPWMGPRYPGEFGGAGVGAVPVGRARMTPPTAAGARPSAGEELTSGIGAGVAELLVDQLLESGGFRVLERRHLDAVIAERAIDSAARAGEQGAGTHRGRESRTAAADYIVTGSVVGFGGEEQHVLGGLGRIAGLGVLGLKRHKTTVTLVARVVRAATGEVLLTARGEGVSRKGSGLTLGGIARGGGGWCRSGRAPFASRHSARRPGARWTRWPTIWPADADRCTRHRWTLRRRLGCDDGWPSRVGREGR